MNNEEGSVEAFAKAFNYEQDRKNKLIEKLEAENKIMKKALQFYGDEHTYQGLLYRHTICNQCQKPPGWNGEIIFKDCGQKARKASGQE